MTEARGRYYDSLPDGRILLVVTLPDGAEADECRVLFADRYEITPDQRRKNMAVFRMVIVVRTIKIRGHNADIVCAILSVQILTIFQAADFGQGIGFIGFFQG